jgi:hypothetical protein
MSSGANHNLFGLSVAQQLCETSGDDWVTIYQNLRHKRKLYVAVHEMNALLNDPTYKDLARAALRRIGLEHGG